jgi:hypothetical protein
MTVYIKGKRRAVVSEVFLHCLNIITRLKSGNGIRVPLWYNNAKSREPSEINGLRVWRYSIPFYFQAKWGLILQLKMTDVK